MIFSSFYFAGGTLSQTVISIENRISDMSSNPTGGNLLFTPDKKHIFGKCMNPSVLYPLAVGEY